MTTPQKRPRGRPPLSPAQATQNALSQAAFKARRSANGLHRREIYAHDDDWPKIKALADALKSKRVPAPLD